MKTKNIKKFSYAIEVVHIETLESTIVCKGYAFGDGVMIASMLNEALPSNSYLEYKLKNL